MKNKLITVKISGIKYPNVGYAKDDNGKTVNIKGTLPGQVVTARVKRKREKAIDAYLVETMEKAAYEISSSCTHHLQCGGCSFRTVPYNIQLELKSGMITALFNNAGVSMGKWQGIYECAETAEYRNKMEFSFGDTQKGGSLSLGMRKKNSFYEVVTVCDCLLVDGDYRELLKVAVEFFSDTELTFYNNRKHLGELRHLVIRKSKKFGDILVILVTTSAVSKKTAIKFKDAILNASLTGCITGVIHSVNDDIADTVKLDNTELLFGKSYFYEQVSGLLFKITPKSFFQTNTLGAELLYEKALRFQGRCKTALDLYCGTGTIAQIMAKSAEKVIGIEIVPEAVEAAIENARLNNITNAEFMCGDVLEVISNINEIPDVIVLDPPRDGVNRKALQKIVRLNAQKIIYISCKVTSLLRDIDVLLDGGYSIDESFAVDMFAWSAHVETVVLMSRKGG